MGITLDDLEQSVEGFPLLGFTISWRLTTLRVDYEYVHTLLQKYNLERYCPSRPSDIVSMRRAIIRWVKLRSQQGALPSLDDEGNGTEEKASRSLVRRMKSSRKNVYHVFALVQEDMNFSNLGIKFGTLVRFLVHKGTKDLVVMTEAKGLPSSVQMAAQEEANQIALELGPIWTEERNILSSTDVSGMLRTLVSDCEAISLRPGGGFYFIPIQQKQRLSQIREILDQIDPEKEKTFMVALPVYDSEAGKKEMSRIAFASIMDEISQLKADLKRTMERDNNKPETLKARLRSYRHMKLRVEAFSIRLGMQQKDLLSAIQEMQKIVYADLHKQEQQVTTQQVPMHNDFSDLTIEIDTTE